MQNDLAVNASASFTDRLKHSRFIAVTHPKLRRGAVRLSNFLSALTSALGAVHFRYYPDDSDPIKT